MIPKDPDLLAFFKEEVEASFRRVDVEHSQYIIIPQSRGHGMGERFLNYAIKCLERVIPPERGMGKGVVV